MRDPIDYDSPLGISKREWTKVLGANLALLLIMYTVALICTMCGSDFFMLNFHSDDLKRIEDTLRSWNVFPLVEILFQTIEVTIVYAYAVKGKIRWFNPPILFAAFVAFNVAFTQTMGAYPAFVPFIVLIAFLVTAVSIEYRKSKTDVLKGLARAAIGLAVSFVLSAMISLFRLSYARIFNSELSNVTGFATNVELDIALVLSLSFLSVALNWEPRKGGSEQCPTNLGASGSCPTATKQSPKRMPSTKRNPNSDIPPKLRKRIRILKAKTIAIQTTALVVVSLLPIVSGRGVEYALVFASFSITRLCLGFKRSLHFKSEMVCVTVAGLIFWGLCFLAPSMEVCLIMSMAYGAVVAVAFRLYWELHDLILYRRVAKLDRYAMFYATFKGNVTPRHIFGVMKSKGYQNNEIEMVTMYMQREKVEAIAIEMSYSKRVIEQRLTDLANELYSSR